MKVHETLGRAFGADFEKLISEFAIAKGLIPEGQAVGNTRFLNRSILPHIERLSSLFNRQEKDQSAGLEPYWTQGSHPANLRLAYFLYFMPCNLFRVASVWNELERLGFKWRGGDVLRAIEFGAGPAAGACGIAAGEKSAPVGLPKTGNWALIEQDKPMLEIGESWAKTYFEACSVGDWGTRAFRRKISLEEGFLPASAPKFNLWVMSFFLNEFSDTPAPTLARALIKTWERHLEAGGLVLILEPALRLQSRRLLELRAALIEESKKQSADWFQILLPCLGHQNCGALADPEDWCHEEVTWWRPPYFRIIDKLASLDRKTLPFSYLVIGRSTNPVAKWFPALPENNSPDAIRRLVSPAHREGRDLEFYTCGTDEKRRVRLNQSLLKAAKAETVERGDLLIDAKLRGNIHASRVEKMKRVI